MRTSSFGTSGSVVAGSLLALAGVAMGACAPSGTSTDSRSQQPAQAPAPPAAPAGFEVAPGLPPLPVNGLAAAPRSVETVRAVYEFAASHPEVLDYVPCFCGCESAGHQSNTHCFVGARNSTGTVTQWDYHGLT